MLIKLEWLGYRTVKKLWQCVKPFSSNPERDGRTDRQICYISISRVSVLTRDKNCVRGSVLSKVTIETRSIARPLCDSRATCCAMAFPCVRLSHSAKAAEHIIRLLFYVVVHHCILFLMSKILAKFWPGNLAGRNVGRV